MNRMRLLGVMCAASLGAASAYGATGDAPPPLPGQSQQPVPATGNSPVVRNGQGAGTASPYGAAPSQAGPNAAPGPQAGGGAQLPGIQAIDNQELANGLAKAAANDGNSAEDQNRRATVNAALNGIFPLKPDEIQLLIEKLHESQHAIAAPQTANLKAVVKAETIPLEPGAEPKEIDTELGFITTVSLLDATGNPWPIQDIGVGGNFDVPAPEEGGNVLRITPLAKYAFGNLSIRLVGLTTPLSFHLQASNGTVYYRYDARIPKFGPKAAAPLIDRGNDLVAGDAMLMNILDGAPPLDATRLPVTGVDTRTAAWRIGTRVYLRTPLMLLSPGWDGSVGSGDGTHVYLIPDTPVLLLSDNGNLVHARIGNNSKPDEQPVPAIEDGRAHPLRTSAATAQAQGDLMTDSSQSIMPTPASSRTLIRPVQSRSAAGAAAGSSNLAGSSTTPINPAPQAQGGQQ